MHDIAEFLRAHEPFAGLEETVLDQLAARTEVEFFGAEDVIFRQGEPELGHVRIIRRGSVELVDSGRVLNLPGEGEWFGHPAMLSGLPTGWAARAAEDTLCYRLAAEDVVPLLARPAGLRFVARSLMERPRPGQPVVWSDGRATSDLPARALIHERLVICDPDTPIREAARRMVEQRASCVLVTLASGELGIMTDHDLRVRVVAEGLSFDEPVSRVMSAPAVTADPDRLGTELMLSMIDSGLVWDGDATPRLDTFAREVLDDLARAGFRPDPHGATAASPLFAARRAIGDRRSGTGWSVPVRRRC